MYYIWRTWIGHSNNNIIVQYCGKGNLTPIEFPFNDNRYLIINLFCTESVLLRFMLLGLRRVSQLQSL